MFAVYMLIGYGVAVGLLALFLYYKEQKRKHDMLVAELEHKRLEKYRKEMWLQDYRDENGNIR